MAFILSSAILFYLFVLSWNMDSRVFWACVENPRLGYCPKVPLKDPRTTTTTAPPTTKMTTTK